MIERWQIYAVPLGSIKPSQVPVRVPFQLDNDAPFVLRGRSIGITETDDTDSPLWVSQLWTRYSDAAEQWNAAEVIPSYIDMPGGGSGGCPGAVYPEKAYPAGAILQTDVYNDGSVDDSTAVDATIYYHGVKLYPDGNYGATYPAKSQPKPYSLTLPGPGRTLTVQVTDTIREYPLMVPADFDFAFRGGVLGWYGAVAGFNNLKVSVKDNRMRPFMNSPCHAYHVFGVPGSQGTPTTKNVLNGAFNPGLFVPEGYVPGNQYLFFDFFRTDAAITEAVACNLQIAFQGSKVVRG